MLAISCVAAILALSLGWLSAELRARAAERRAGPSDVERLARLSAYVDAYDRAALEYEAAVVRWVSTLPTALVPDSTERDAIACASGRLRRLRERRPDGGEHGVHPGRHG